MSDTSSFPVPARMLITAAAGVVVIAGMHLGASILNVILFSFFLGIIALPFIRMLEERGVPTLGAVLILIGGLALILILFISILSLSLPALDEALPAYEELLRDQLESLSGLLAGFGIVITPPDQGSIINGTTTLIPAIATIVSGLIQFFIDLLLVIIIAVFMVLEVSGWGAVLDRQPEIARKVGAQLAGFSRTLITYVVIRVRINLITGAATAALLWALGIPSPLLWGLVVFVLSFIPYFGLALASIPPAGIAWLQLGLAGATAVLVGIAIINFVAETIIFPPMAGKGLNLSPLTVIISVIVWTWILGVPGMFLGVPLTLMVKFLLEAFEETAGIARLMEPAGQGGGRRSFFRR